MHETARKHMISAPKIPPSGAKDTDIVELCLILFTLLSGNMEIDFAGDIGSAVAEPAADSVKTGPLCRKDRCHCVPASMRSEFSAEHSF